MIKSELVQKIADKNPHLYHRDVERIVNRILDEVIGPEEIRLTRSTDHYDNFLEGVRTRRETITPAETAHRSASIGHLCLISMRLGRKLRWNPVKERFVNDPEADRMLMGTLRSPWSL